MILPFYRALLLIEVFAAFAVPTAYLVFGASQVVAFAAVGLTSMDSEIIPLLILMIAPTSLGTFGMWAVVRLTTLAFRFAKVRGDRWLILASAAAGVSAWVIVFGGPPGTESTFARQVVLWAPLLVTVQLLYQTWPQQRTRAN